MQQDMIVVIDLGSEENAILARKIRALGVYSEIHPHDITESELAALPNVKGIILNGGKNRVVDGVEIDASEAVYSSGLPLFAADHRGCAPWPNDEAMTEKILSEFIFEKCGAAKNWNIENFSNR